MLLGAGPKPYLDDGSLIWPQHQEKRIAVSIYFHLKSKLLKFRPSGARRHGKHALEHADEPGTPPASLGTGLRERPGLGWGNSRKDGGGGAPLNGGRRGGRRAARALRVCAGRLAPGALRAARCSLRHPWWPPEDKELCSSFSWLRSCWNLLQKSSTSIDQVRPAGNPAWKGPFQFHKSVQRKRNHLTERSDSQRRRSQEMESSNVWFLLVKSFPLEPTSSETHLKQKRVKRSHSLIGRHHSDTRSLILQRPNTRQLHRHRASLQNYSDQEEETQTALSTFMAKK